MRAAARRRTGIGTSPSTPRAAILSLMDPARALKISGGMLAVALLLLRGSILAVLVALAAAIPAGYAMWLGGQEEGQKTYLYALLLFLGSLLGAAFLLVAWLL